MYSLAGDVQVSRRGDSRSLCAPRAMKPPGGEASDLFGSPEEAAPSSRPNRMASNIFGPTEEPQNIPKRTNPPGMGLCESSALWLLPVLFHAVLG